MEEDGLSSLIDRLSKESGVPRLRAHLIRHTYGTRFLVAEGDVFTLQENLGHESLAMTQRFVHIANRIASLMSQKFSPLDRIQARGTRPIRQYNRIDRRKGQIYTSAGKRTRDGANFRRPARTS